MNEPLSRVEHTGNRLTVGDVDFYLHGLPADARRYLVDKAIALEARYEPLLALGVEPVATNCPEFTRDVLLALWPVSAVEGQTGDTWTVRVKCANPALGSRHELV